MDSSIMNVSSSFNKSWIKILILLPLSFILVWLLSSFYPTGSFKENEAPQDFTAYIDEKIPDLMKDYHIPGCIIALIHKGEIIWTNAYGYADVENEIPMTTDTRCRVESISKSVTAWGVMKLVEQGRIELDQPVIDYLKNWELPETEFAEDEITIKRLLSNSAGMPLGTIGVRYSPLEEKPTLQENLTQDAVLMQEPGKGFYYSNTGYNLLELLIEEITHQDFAAYMNEQVLVPLGMNDASYNWSQDWNPGVPNGYDLQGDAIPVYVYPNKGAGGLFATVKDIATFVMAGMQINSNETHPVLQSWGIQQIYTPWVNIPGLYGLVFESYGFGHFIETLDGGIKAVAHGGQGSGWMTHFHSIPETGDGIVILTNSQRSWPFFSYLLTNWVQWCGFSGIGMELIIIGQIMVWTIIGLLFFLSTWMIWTLVFGIYANQRHFSPLSNRSRYRRTGQFILFAILLSMIIWSISQDYFFLSSIFPNAIIWLGFTMLFFALALILSALFPIRKPKT